MNKPTRPGGFRRVRRFPAIAVFVRTRTILRVDRKAVKRLASRKSPLPHKNSFASSVCS
jgi:hypothetical protein